MIRGQIPQEQSHPAAVYIPLNAKENNFERNNVDILARENLKLERLVKRSSCVKTERNISE